MQDAVRPDAFPSYAPLTSTPTGTTSSSSSGSNGSGTLTMAAKAMIPSLGGAGLLRTRLPPLRPSLPRAGLPLCTPVVREPAEEPPLVTVQDRRSQMS